MNQYRHEETEGWDAETKEVQTEMEETNKAEWAQDSNYTVHYILWRWTCVCSRWIERFMEYAKSQSVT